MTFEDIVKALEDAMNIGDAPIGKYWGCIITKQAAKEALDLINRQQAEVAELKEKNAGLALALLCEVVNEDEQLRNEITKVAVSEAVKEFAERLKDEIISDTAYGCDINQHSGYYDYSIKIGDIPEYIDNLLKEMG